LPSLWCVSITHPRCRIAPAHPHRVKQRRGPERAGQSGVLQPARGNCARPHIGKPATSGRWLKSGRGSNRTLEHGLPGAGYSSAPQQGQMIPNKVLLVHLSPLKWEHINWTGDYHWRRDGGLRNRKLRPLRTAFAPPPTLPLACNFLRNRQVTPISWNLARTY
jgi:hypothetical protein